MCDEISNAAKIIGLCCKKNLYKRLYSAKETYNFKEPTNRNHSIPAFCVDTQNSHVTYMCDTNHAYVTKCDMCDTTHTYVTKL